MPLISVHTSQPLSPSQRDALKTGLGQAVTLIPGKTEAQLMVEFLDQVPIYKGGQNEGHFAVVEVKCFRSVPFQDNQRFTQAVFGLLGQQLGIPENHIYLTLTELPTWGTMGSLKQ